mmetsp:Transcript_31937/g.98895  ORF Transcript_31937/g.98895 Transcript_31937/m.98895 type:complete len:231 (+) Transcript_31937:50-742(+)|eukprot:CAMPEP_0174850520 /NCGR_PEP_ID=MMETSP1114-20130205/19752_1 /TAXON_ID=312471 /ORGANISM="Neobodo designis, Strain CCAP 1951/1" /LENGTH=230 /DNA_ID=CAMNT_0016084983 /DNA_START=48 /DNA_END=740 /DNA_ORIENTATION=+
MRAARQLRMLPSADGTERAEVAPAFSGGHPPGAVSDAVTQHDARPDAAQRNAAAKVPAVQRHHGADRAASSSPLTPAIPCSPPAQAAALPVLHVASPPTSPLPRRSRRNYGRSPQQQRPPCERTAFASPPDGTVLPLPIVPPFPLLAPEGRGCRETAANASPSTFSYSTDRTHDEPASPIVPDPQPFTLLVKRTRMSRAESVARLAALSRGNPAVRRALASLPSAKERSS